MLVIAVSEKALSTILAENWPGKKSGRVNIRVAQMVVRSAAGYQQLMRRHRDRALNLDLASSTMKSAWRALEREKLRAEAKAQLATLQEAERIEERGRMEELPNSR